MQEAKDFARKVSYKLPSWLSIDREAREETVGEIMPMNCRLRKASTMGETC